jgi:hypothetical protein
LHDSLDPGVDGFRTPFEALMDLEIDVHHLACPFKDVAVLDLKQVL